MLAEGIVTRDRQGQERRCRAAVIDIGQQKRVERFCKPSNGTPSEAKEAINALEQECLALNAALSEHPLAAQPKQDD